MKRCILFCSVLFHPPHTFETFLAVTDCTRLPSTHDRVFLKAVRLSFLVICTMHNKCGNRLDVACTSLCSNIHMQTKKWSSDFIFPFSERRLLFFILYIFFNCPWINRIRLSLTKEGPTVLPLSAKLHPQALQLHREDVLDQVAQLETESTGFSTTSTPCELLLSVQ